MTATTSHRHDHSFLGVLMVATAWVSLVTLSCDRTEQEATQSENIEAEPAAFAWPEDPSHPSLRFDIEGAAGSGAIEIELMPELAPKTVAQIVEWANEGFYDDTTFHRVIKDFMIQGGDPNTRDRIVANDGQGGPGFSLEDEFSDAPFVRGVVAMGNKGSRNSAGSQFFITQADAPHLDGRHTIIGRVRSGMEIVDAIVEVEIDRVGRWGPANRPIEDVVLKRVRQLDPEAVAARTAESSEPSAESPAAANTTEREEATRDSARKDEAGGASPAAPAP